MTQHLFQNRTRLNLDKLWNGIWCLSLVTALNVFPLLASLMISEVPVTRVSYLVLVFRPCDRYSNQYHHAFRWYNNKFDKPSCAIIILLINTCWILIGRTDTEVEAPILWPPNANSWLIGKDPDAEKIEGRRRREWQRIRRLDGITDSMDMNLGKLGDDEKQRGLVCYSPWGHKELDMTWRLNSNNINKAIIILMIPIIIMNINGTLTKSQGFCMHCLILLSQKCWVDGIHCYRVLVELTEAPRG